MPGCLFYWEETPGRTQNLMEGLHIQFGQGTLWDPKKELDNFAGEREIKERDEQQNPESLFIFMALISLILNVVVP